MQNYLKNKTLTAAIIFFFEIIALTVIFIFKQFGIIADYLFDAAIGTIIIIMIINFIFILATISKMSKLKVKSDITTLEVLGSDVKDIYEFSKIGLIVVDDNDKIIWTNDWIGESQYKLIDKDILKFCPDLIKLKKADNEMETIIEINGNKYNATYKKSANLFILKDVTDIENIKKYHDAHTPVVGIINIDNYQDLTSILDDISLNDMLLLVQKDISNYAKKFNVCLRKYKTDSYLAICTSEVFEKLKNDKFSLLNEVKKHNENGYQMTISMGFAYGLDDFNKLSEMAISSLNFALSRGGDQVVVFPYGKNYIYFGGSTDAKLKNNQSKIRVLSQTLSDTIKTSSDVYIMGHIDADLDAIGSSLGLYAFAKVYRENVKIIFSEELMENKANIAFKQTCSAEEIKNIAISPADAKKQIKKNSLLILTDVQKASISMDKELVEKASKIAVIDHHRKSEDSVHKPVLQHIDPSASSACEIVIEFIRHSRDRIVISQKVATLMLAGILLDTNYYRNKTGSITYDASLVLKNYGADNLIASSFLKEDYNEYVLKTRIKNNIDTPLPGIMVCFGYDDIIEKSMLAIVAQETLDIQGVKACFVIGKISERLIGISGRSDGTFNCQLLMEKMGGGGHFGAAAAQIEITNNKTIQDVYDDLKYRMKELSEIYQQ